jgi:hypothetical protein
VRNANIIEVSALCNFVIPCCCRSYRTVPIKCFACTGAGLRELGVRNIRIRARTRGEPKIPGRGESRTFGPYVLHRVVHANNRYGSLSPLIRSVTSVRLKLAVLIRSRNRMTVRYDFCG